MGQNSGRSLQYRNDARANVAAITRLRTETNPTRMDIIKAAAGTLDAFHSPDTTKPNASE